MACSWIRAICRELGKYVEKTVIFVMGQNDGFQLFLGMFFILLTFTSSCKSLTMGPFYHCSLLQIVKDI